MSRAPGRLGVLHLTAGSDAGGVSRYLYDLCQAMTAQGHEVAIAGQRGAWHELFRGAPWPWIELPLKGGPLALWRSSRALRRFVIQHDIQVLHTHYRRATLVARLVARGRRLPVLTTLHLTGLGLSGWTRRLSDFGDHTLAASHEARQWLMDQARVPAQRISVIPHGIDPQRFPLADDHTQREARARLGLPAEACVAAFVGRFDQPKNEDWILDLAEAAQTRLPHLHLLMVGEGPHEDALRQRVERRGWSGQVRLLDYRDPLPVYQAADALLLPSSQEGFSLVCAEAMSVGRPVLRTRTAGTSLMIVEGRTGRSVPIDRRAFVDTALSMLADRDELRRMGRAAAEHVRRHLTFDHQLQATLALYRQLVGHAPASSLEAGP